jgi:hypothetical protein
MKMKNMLPMATVTQRTQKRKLPHILGTFVSQINGTTKSKRKRNRNQAIHAQKPLPII